ncbi:MAG: heme exporter protein CcmD [Rhodospirillales bacterium]|nr:heme exporter protein CcmD [Rhodospirillales bacterium]MDP6883237.1 heme exporter protein CcmD [Rhodospirillales bacterium]
MDSITSFFHMGGYGAYVWPSFVITLVVLGALFAHSLSFLRAGETALKELQDEKAPAEDEASDEA